MSKLLSTLGRKLSAEPKHATSVRLSRFDTDRNQPSPGPYLNGKYTRFPSKTNARTVDVTPRVQPQHDVTPALQQAINTADHLISEAQIPVSILQRALPKRFATMQDDQYSDFFA